MSSRISSQILSERIETFYPPTLSEFDKNVGKWIKKLPPTDAKHQAKPLL
jgi:hypothetical protein